MNRKFIYDESDKLVDFEDEDFEFIEKHFDRIIPYIFVKDKKNIGFCFFYLIPKTHKAVELREKIFGYMFKTEKEMREKFKSKTIFGGEVDGKNIWL